MDITVKDLMLSNLCEAVLQVEQLQFLVSQLCSGKCLLYNYNRFHIHL